jgi:hypothetical protein
VGYRSVVRRHHNEGERTGVCVIFEFLDERKAEIVLLAEQDRLEAQRLQIALQLQLTVSLWPWAMNTKVTIPSDPRL